MPSSSGVTTWISGNSARNARMRVRMSLCEPEQVNAMPKNSGTPGPVGANGFAQCARTFQNGPGAVRERRTGRRQIDAATVANEQFHAQFALRAP